jgi:hypothetical protein
MKRVTLVGLVIVLVFSIFIGGCKKSSSSPTSNNNTSTQTGTIAVTVGSGNNPTYTWAGGGVLNLTVTQTSGTAGPVWGLASNSGTNSIASPVTHGTAPSGATETFTSGRTLTTGASYTINVMRVDGSYGTVNFSR